MLISVLVTISSKHKYWFWYWIRNNLDISKCPISTPNQRLSHNSGRQPFLIFDWNFQGHYLNLNGSVLAAVSPLLSEVLRSALTSCDTCHHIQEIIIHSGKIAAKKYCTDWHKNGYVRVFFLHGLTKTQGIFGKTQGKFWQNSRNFWQNSSKILTKLKQKCQNPKISTQNSTKNG